MQTKKIIKSLSELPTMPSTIGTMEWNQTGDWRYLTPVVANKPAPCSRNCPVGHSDSGLSECVKQGDVQIGVGPAAGHNPLPGLTGRLCYHPCQTKCARKKIDRSISIREIERFLARSRRRSKDSRQNKRTDKRVTVIGSGPLGLSCAFYLGCRGLQGHGSGWCSQAGGALIWSFTEKIRTQFWKTKSIVWSVLPISILRPTLYSISTHPATCIEGRSYHSGSDRPFRKSYAYLPEQSLSIPL